jgi:hypothetical protein
LKISEINKDLINEINIFENNRTSRGWITMQVGQYVDELCRKSNTDECKEMYFNILNN